jgi:Ca2+-binding RTX toxin-like protein
VRFRTLLIAAVSLLVLPSVAGAKSVDLGDHVTWQDGAYYCFGQKATLIGTEGDDELTLTPAEDVVVALGGNDTVSYEIRWDDPQSNEPTYVDPTVPSEWWDEGDWSESSPSAVRASFHDIVCGGAGNDRIQGAATVDGGKGNDGISDGRLVYGGSGYDVISTWDGEPTEVHGGKGDDTISTGFDSYEEGDDRYTQTDAYPGDTDNVWGDEGNDVIETGTGNDKLQGGPGNDRLGGWVGDDRLFGGPGNDYLHGDQGTDECWMGDGKKDVTTETCEGPKTKKKRAPDPQYRAWLEHRKQCEAGGGC